MSLFSSSLGRRRARTSPVRLVLAAALVAAVAAPAAPVAAQQADLQYEVLSQATTDPLAIQVADDGRVIWGQRDGTVWVLTPEGVQVRAGQLAVSANACPTCLQQDRGHTLWHGLPNPGGVAGLEEGGLHGMLLAKDFATSGRIYLYRSIPGSRNPGPEMRQTADGHPIPPTFGVFRLSTYVLTAANVLDPLSEEVILEVPVHWDHCCHYGGKLNWMPDGTILLSTGDDVHFSASSGYGPRDHRNIWHNAEQSSANPADRRGKLLRLMPDGSVPDGSQEGIAPNPFIGHEGWNPYLADAGLPDTSGTPGDGWVAFDPYVYALGFKQPFRGTVHPATGTAYFGDVGPDATSDDPLRGPAGKEEINVIPPGGGTHHGWPRCMADNLPYMDVDWETMEVGGPLDCSADALVSRPLPGAPHAEERRGMTGATIWYGRTLSDRWPVFRQGGLTSEPIGVYPADAKGPLRLPERFADRLIVLEYSRNIIVTIPVNRDGSLELDNDKMERITAATTSVNPGGVQGAVSIRPQADFTKPIDGAIGPDGALYFLEYGLSLYGNPYSRVSRIKCAGCSPLDATKNYGLPLHGTEGTAGSLRSSGVLPGSPAPWLVAALALAAGVLRRRRVLL